MIPAKRTKNSFPPDGWKTMSIQEKDNWIKTHPSKPTTLLQKLAQKENFALFQLSAMRTNCHHLKDVLIEEATYTNLLVAINRAEHQIRSAQTYRKRERLVGKWMKENTIQTIMLPRKRNYP
jgi:hypothetical protein